MNGYSITVPRNRLEAWLRPALVCAGTDDMLPVLTNVHMVLTPDHALAVTTDRFRAAMSRLRYDKPVEVEHPAGTTLSVLLSASGIANMLAFHKAGRSSAHRSRPITITVPADGDRATFLDVCAGVSVTLGEQPGQFPGVVSLIAEAMKRAVSDDTAPIREVGVSMNYLAAFKAAAPPHTFGQATRITSTGKDKPLLIQPSDDFIGLLMPRRVADPDATPPPITAGWEAVIGLPEKGATK